MLYRIITYILSDKRSKSRFCIYMLLLQFMPMIIFAQENEFYKQDIVHPKSTKGSISYGIITLDQARSLLLAEMINESIATYAQLYAKDTSNVSLIAEYAYSLALGGFYDVATSYLDRIRSIGVTTISTTKNIYKKQLYRSAAGVPANVNVYYYAAQIFALMEYYDLSNEFLNQTLDSKTPEWIASSSSYFLQKYKRKSKSLEDLSRQNLLKDFKLANQLASQSGYFQSIILFQKITDQFPNDYLPYVGYSIILAKIGFYKKSSEKLEKAISLVKENPDQLETVKYLEDQLTLNNQKLKLQSSQRINDQMFISNNTDIKPHMMAYVGGSIGSSYTSVNGRIGFFIKNSMNAAFDIGVSSFAGVKSTNLGLSCYSRDRIFAYGAGLIANFGTGDPMLYYKASVGLSFMRKKSSLDLFLDFKLPVKKDSAPTIISISVGQSAYFGNRK